MKNLKWIGAAGAGTMILFIAQTLFNGPTAKAQTPRAEVQITGHIYRLAQLPAPATSALRVPQGFKIERFAENAGNARMLAIGPDGSVYVTRREEADVLRFRVGPNGLASGAPTRVTGRAGLHGIAIDGQTVYLATVHEVFTAKILPDGGFGPLQMIIHDLPDAGQHHTRTLQVGPDRNLYISVGSTCNECAEPNPENAAMLQASLDGKNRTIFASGLRDTIGWGWHPTTGELWGMDHGTDWLGDDQQAEELNKIERGKRYGWPYVFADSLFNAHLDPPGGISKEEWAQSSVPMKLGYTAHSAPMQMSFYGGNQFPAEFVGDAFISMRGSWNRKPASGYEVLRIRFQDGEATGFEPFVTGFLTPEGERGRLAGNAVARDGSLLFTDDRNGVIYRVSYTALAATGAPRPVEGALSPPRKSDERQRLPMAMEAFGKAIPVSLQVESASFKDKGAIPLHHSAYDQNASPHLRWSAGPPATQSYVVLMEDPDANTTPLPVSHWVVWNIPSSLTALHEGMPTSEELTEPEGVRQGPNYSGAPGYQGPKPPEANRPHRYFIQVFALDSKLSLPPGSDRDVVRKAMEGHVLGAGQVQGTFVRPERPAKP